MNEEKTPLGSIPELTVDELDSLEGKGISSAEDLLAMVKSFEDSPEQIFRLLGIKGDRLSVLMEKSREMVSKEFLDMLDSPFDADQFKIGGALPPDDKD